MIPSEVVPTPGRDLGDTSPSLGAQCPAKRRCALPRPSARTRCTLQRACNGAGRSQGRRFLEPLGRATSCRHSPATAVAAARMRRPAALSPPCLPCWWCLHLSSFAALSARRPSCSPRRQLQRPWSSSCLLRSPPCESHPSRASMAATAARPHPPPPPNNGRCPLPRAAVLARHLIQHAVAKRRLLKEMASVTTVRWAATTVLLSCTAPPHPTVVLTTLCSTSALRSAPCPRRARPPLRARSALRGHAARPARWPRMGRLPTPPPSPARVAADHCTGRSRRPSSGRPTCLVWPTGCSSTA